MILTSPPPKKVPPCCLKTAERASRCIRGALSPFFNCKFHLEGNLAVREVRQDLNDSWITLPTWMLCSKRRSASLLEDTAAFVAAVGERWMGGAAAHDESVFLNVLLLFCFSFCPELKALPAACVRSPMNSQILVCLSFYLFVFLLKRFTEWPTALATCLRSQRARPHVSVTVAFNSPLCWQQRHCFNCHVTQHKAKFAT